MVRINALPQNLSVLTGGFCTGFGITIKSL